MDILQTLQTNEDIESFPCTDCDTRVYVRYFIGDNNYSMSEGVCEGCGATYTDNKK